MKTITMWQKCKVCGAKGPEVTRTYPDHLVPAMEGLGMSGEIIGTCPDCQEKEREKWRKDYAVWKMTGRKPS